VEAISPGKTRRFIIGKIRSESGEVLEVAHGGGRDVFIEVPFPTESYTLFRKIINNKQKHPNLSGEKPLEKSE
jgi:hypothetical protein